MDLVENELRLKKKERKKEEKRKERKAEGFWLQKNRFVALPPFPSLFLGVKLSGELG